MKVTLVRAWSRRFEQETVVLAEGACVADALRVSSLVGNPSNDAPASYTPAPACAVFGVNADPGTRLHEGDRIELLRPLQLDPKEARRKRALKGTR